MTTRAETIAKTADVFNSAADYFDHPVLDFWDRFGQQTVDRLALKPGDRVLDVCCGTGASAIPSGLRVGPTGEVLGTDLAEALLELARKKSQHRGLQNITFQVGDFEHLGLPDASFDAVVCVFGIFFVPDMVAATQELWRMVRPGGQLAITSWGSKIFEPATQFFWEAIEAERPDLHKKFTPWDRISQPDSLKALLESGGATQVEVFTEQAQHPLSGPEDWWTMVLGGGLRGLIDQLTPDENNRLRQANLDYLQNNQIQTLESEVLYAIAHK
ncbi:MAG: class I SAM-dependent methyltransferase [Alkalinema sp. RU_4_3]|nr:class I SAM-dependent methyltransferase [Alkalinema sp. RU_4_3]